MLECVAGLNVMPHLPRVVDALLIWIVIYGKRIGWRLSRNWRYLSRGQQAIVSFCYGYCQRGEHPVPSVELSLLINSDYLISCRGCIDHLLCRLSWSWLVLIGQLLHCRKDSGHLCFFLFQARHDGNRLFSLDKQGSDQIEWKLGPVFHTRESVYFKAKARGKGENHYHYIGELTIQTRYGRRQTI